MQALEEVAADGPAFRSSFACTEGYRPLYVKIKLLYGCNLLCPMCSHWREVRPVQLDTGRLRALFEELVGLGCRKIHLTGGEPGLRPDLVALVGHAAGLGLRVTLTTNGTLLTRERSRGLAEAGLRGVNVSIDSPDPAVHDASRVRPGAWQQAVQALKHLARERHHGKLSLSINCVVTRHNYRTLGALPKLALKLGVRSLRLLPVDDHLGLGLRLSREQIEEWNHALAPGFAEAALRAGLIAAAAEAYPFGRTPEALDESAQGGYALGYYRSHPCFAPFTHALVDHDGHVYVCCMTRGGPLLGDLHTASFGEIWRGAVYRQVRAAMRDGQRLPACASCDDFVEQNRRLLRVLAEPPPLSVPSIADPPPPAPHRSDSAQPAGAPPGPRVGA